MALPNFYNVGDQAIYSGGEHFIPQEKYRLGYKAPLPTSETETVTQGFGIPYTNAFTGGGGGGSGGNAFGYGTAIRPGDPSVLTSGPYAGQSGYYGSSQYTGGLPGNVTQKGPGRHFEYDDSGEVYRDYSLTPKKELPWLASAALSVVPFGGLIRGQIDKRMNPEGPLTGADINKGTYKVGGMDASMKNLYDSLAAQGMLFEGAGGLKTMTGKNLMGKGYLEGQLDIYNQEFTKEDGSMMTEDEINDAIAAQQLNKKGQFKYRQMKEAKIVYDKNKAFEGKDPTVDGKVTAGGTTTGGGGGPPPRPQNIIDSSKGAWSRSRNPSGVVQHGGGGYNHPGSAESRQTSDPFNEGGIARLL